MPRGVTLGPRFRDGLGVRVVEVDKTSGDTIEVLQLCPELCAFEKAIKDRTVQLSNFRHPRFVPVRGVRAVSGPHSRLGVIADHIVGPRLSEILEAARDREVTVDTNAALHLIKELLSAISVLHESRKVTHGALAAERLIVTPRGRLVIADYTLSLALERLQYNRPRLWRDFRIAMPPTAGAARFDEQADVVQIGTLALALLLGRQLDASDYTDRLKQLLDGAGELTVHGDRKPLSSGLCSWLERALPLEARRPFATVQQANTALEQILTKERRLSVAPAALKAFISRYLSHTGGCAAETQEPPIDRPKQPGAEVATTVEPLATTEPVRAATLRQEVPLPGDEARARMLQNVTVSLPVGFRRDDRPLSSAVIEADPDVGGPFAAIPLEILPEDVSAATPRTIPAASSEAALEVVSQIGSGISGGVVSETSCEITVEVASGIDTGITVEVASGLVPETTLDIAPAGALETVPEKALEVVSETTLEKVPDGTSEIVPETNVEVAPEAALETTPECRPGISLEIAPRIAPEIGRGGVPEVAPSARGEATEQGGLPADLAPKGCDEATRERHREPVPEVATEEVWVIDPSDLTFDPAFLDGLYVAPHADLGPLVPRPLGKVDAAPAAKSSPQTAERRVVPPLAPAGDAVSFQEPATASPAPLAVQLEAVPTSEAMPSERVEEPAASEELVAPEAVVPARDAQPAGSVAAVSAPPESLPALGGIWPDVEESPVPAAESAAVPVAEPVAESVGEPVAEPIVAAIAPDGSLGAAEPPAASLPAVPEPLEVLPALEATWPFVEESPAPATELIGKPAAESAAEPVGEPVAEPVAEPIARAIAPDGSLGAATPPAASLTAVPEPLEVLPALEASWPFVEELPAPATELIAKSTAESAAVPVAESVAEPVAEPIAGAVAPDRSLDATAPPAGKEALPTEVVREAPGVQAPPLHAVMPVVEDSGIQEAVEVFERLLDSLQEAQVTPAVGAFSVPAGAPLNVAVEMPAGADKQAAAPDEIAATTPAPEPEVPVPAAHDETPLSRSPVLSTGIELSDSPGSSAEAFGLEPRPSAADDTGGALPPPYPPAVTPVAPAMLPTLGSASPPSASVAASPCDQAPPDDHASASPGARVLTFEPPPMRSGPTAVTPTGETPSTPVPGRVLSFFVWEKVARLAGAVPRRLIEFGRTRVRRRETLAAALVLVALGGVRLATAYLFKAPPPTGGLTVESVPDGLDVFIDNTPRGRTPMSLTLLAGDHTLELRGKGLARTLPVRIAPGVDAVERLSWPLSARTGSVRVESEPPGATVSIDGESKGVTPLTIEDLPARAHTLVVQGKGGRVEQTVAIGPEQTTTVKVPVYPGWMAVFAPFELRILEGGRLLGTTDADRIMLRAGRHMIEFVNEGLGFRIVRQVSIKPGDLTPVSIEPPKGTLQIEAPPGFEVWLDGERVGETPLAPLEVSLGTHDVRLTHAQAGEQRRTVVVTQREPAKVTAEGK